MRRFWDDHSLGIVLTVAFVVQLAASAGLGWLNYVSDSEAHKQPVETSGYWLWFGQAMLISLIADTYGALILVFGTKWWREKYSAESH